MMGVSNPLVPATEAAGVPSRRQRWRQRYLLATVGGFFVVFWLIIMVIGPYVAPYAPNNVDVMNRLKPPSNAHWLGTDVLGRDILSRILVGTRISLPAGFAVVLIGGAFGTLFGAIAAFGGRKAEEVMMRLTDLFLSFPPLILAMAIAAALGVGTLNTILAMLVVWWPKYARLGRSVVIQQRSLEYVQAARVLGYSPGRTLFRHIAPNAGGPLIVLLTLDVGQAVITFAGLSFLGLGAVPPAPEWGAMVSSGRLLIDQWWVSAFPGLAIFTVVMGFNFLGDGIRDWLDPKARLR